MVLMTAIASDLREHHTRHGQLSGGGSAMHSTDVVVEGVVVEEKIDAEEMALHTGVGNSDSSSIHAA